MLLIRNLFTFTINHVFLSSLASVYLPMETLLSGQILGGSYTGDVTGPGASIVQGKLGKALSISQTAGGDTSVDLGAIRDNCFGDPSLCSEGLTLSFWINRASTNGATYYICNGGQTGASYGISSSSKSNGIIHFAIKTKTHWFTIDSNSVTMGNWHHVVISWPHDKRFKLYVDGEYIDQSNEEVRAISSTQYNNFYLGKPNNGDMYFGTVIFDEILFWDSPKEANFITDLYQSYNDPFALKFNSNDLFKVVDSRAIIVEVEPLKTCEPRQWVSRGPHPCRVQCLWLPWCGAVVNNGTTCKYYNVITVEEVQTNSQDTLYIKN